MEAAEYFENRKDELCTLLAQLVEIETPSYNKEQNERICDWIVNYIAGFDVQHSITIERHKTDIGDNLVLRLGGNNNTQETRLCVGHTDTVHPIGSIEKNKTRKDLENDRFYGCGAFDMKAGVLILLEALRYIVLRNLDLHFNLNVVLNCDEEIGSPTSTDLIVQEAKIASVCFVLEGALLNGQVKTGRKGMGRYALQTQGIAAHAGLEPQKGASAILELSHQVIAISKLGNLDAGTSVMVGVIKGGTASNVVPAAAECTIDVRFTNIDEAKRVDGELKRLRPINNRVELILKGGIECLPLERTEKVIQLYHKAKAIGESLDYPLDEAQVGGSSDGNTAAQYTVVLDGLGPRGDGAHTLQEYIVLSDLSRRAAFFTKLLTSHI